MNYQNETLNDKWSLTELAVNLFNPLLAFPPSYDPTTSNSKTKSTIFDIFQMLNMSPSFQITCKKVANRTMWKLRMDSRKSITFIFTFLASKLKHQHRWFGWSNLKVTAAKQNLSIPSCTAQNDYLDYHFCTSSINFHVELNFYLLAL